MISFHDMAGTLILAIVLATATFVAAALAEGRGALLLDLLRGLRGGRRPEAGVLDQAVERKDMDWGVVAQLDSPTRERDGEHVPTLGDLGVLKSRMSAVRASVPAVRSHLPALKDLPVLRSLTDSRDGGVETVSPAMADTASR